MTTYTDERRIDVLATRVPHCVLLHDIQIKLVQGNPDGAWQLFTDNQDMIGDFAGHCDQALRDNGIDPDNPDAGGGTTPVLPAGPLVTEPYDLAAAVQQKPSPKERYTTFAYAIVVPADGMIPGSKPPRPLRGIRLSFGGLLPNDQVKTYGNLSIKAGEGVRSANLSVGGGSANVDLGGTLDGQVVKAGDTIYGNLYSPDLLPITLLFSAYGY